VNEAQQCTLSRTVVADEAYAPLTQVQRQVVENPAAIAAQMNAIEGETDSRYGTKLLRQIILMDARITF
jgi:hypothetical protein